MQTQVLEQPAFDAASIRRNTSGDTARTFRLEPGGIRAANVPVSYLIQLAYEVQQSHIIGGPNWIAAERYDVIARAAGSPTPERLRAMLRNLLADRFQLDVEQTTRELPVYFLVGADTNGKLGPICGRQPASVPIPSRRKDAARTWETAGWSREACR